jgi:hypothetical protein
MCVSAPRSKTNTRLAISYRKLKQLRLGPLPSLPPTHTPPHTRLPVYHFRGPYCRPDSANVPAAPTLSELPSPDHHHPRFKQILLLRHKRVCCGNLTSEGLASRTEALAGKGITIRNQVFQPQENTHAEPRHIRHSPRTPKQQEATGERERDRAWREIQLKGL